MYFGNNTHSSRNRDKYMYCTLCEHKYNLPRRIQIIVAIIMFAISFIPNDQPAAIIASNFYRLYRLVNHIKLKLQIPSPTAVHSPNLPLSIFTTSQWSNHRRRRDYVSTTVPSTTWLPRVHSEFSRGWSTEARHKPGRHSLHFEVSAGFSCGRRVLANLRRAR